MVQIKIDAVLFESEPGYWVGQYLQYDIGAQAESLPDLAYEMDRAIVGHVVICMHNNVEPFSDVQAAPQEYWDMWNEAKLTVRTDSPGFRLPMPLPLPIPETAMRVASS